MFSNFQNLVFSKLGVGGGGLNVYASLHWLRTTTDYPNGVAYAVIIWYMAHYLYHDILQNHNLKDANLKGSWGCSSAPHAILHTLWE